MRESSNNRRDISNRMRLIPLKAKEGFHGQISHNFGRKDNISFQPTHFSHENPLAPVFRTSVDTNVLKKKPDYFQRIYNERLEKYQEEEKILKKLLLPKPQDKNFKYCRVCDQFYEEYDEHITSEDHKTNFQAHDYHALLQKEAENLHNDFEKKKMEFIKQAISDTNQDQQRDSGDPTKMNIQGYQSKISKQIIEVKIANIEPDKTDTITKIKFIKYNLFEEKPTLHLDLFGTAQTQLKREKIDPCQKCKFSEGETLRMKNEDEDETSASSGSRTSKDKFQLGSRQTEEVSLLKKIEENKSMQISCSFKTNGQNFELSIDTNEKRPLKPQPKLQLQFQENDGSHPNDQYNHFPPKRNLKRTYSTFSNSEELLRHFKNVKIADLYSQSQSTASSQKKEPPIKIDLQKVDGGKWERFKKSCAGLVCEIKDKVDRLYDFWKRKELSS